MQAAIAPMVMAEARARCGGLASRIVGSSMAACMLLSLFAVGSAEAQQVVAPSSWTTRLDLGTPSQLGAGTGPDVATYSTATFIEQAKTVPLEFAGLFAGITYIGITNWNWGNAGFRFQSEGWFGANTGSGGIDKLGHAYTTYVMSDILTYGIKRRMGNVWGAEFTGALLSMALMTYVEVFDGYSGDHGFSQEDMVADLAGAGFSVLRNMVPGLREKLDFRMQYVSSGFKGDFEPLSDYAGQRYLLALKLAGFDGLRETPLRFIELHAGYYARGFTRAERHAGIEKDRELYFGVGVNLQELLFGAGPHKDHWLSQGGRTALEYIQLPYTYVGTDGRPGR